MGLVDPASWECKPEPTWEEEISADKWPPEDGPMGTTMEAFSWLLIERVQHMVGSASPGHLVSLTTCKSDSPSFPLFLLLVVVFIRAAEICLPCLDHCSSLSAAAILTLSLGIAPSHQQGQLCPPLLEVSAQVFLLRETLPVSTAPRQSLLCNSV